MTTLTTSALPLELLVRGKVRDVYVVDYARLLLVATDRVSAFDVVMAEAVPFKGAVLTQLTAWWLGQLEGLVAHHLLSADADEIVRQLPQLDGHQASLRGRAMLCIRTSVVPVECVVRGYLAGSAWAEYREHGTLAGERLPIGLGESDRLDPVLFSPATKAATGHDENITVDQMRAAVGESLAATLERLARGIYAAGCAIAEPRGILIADTKFEFGLRDGLVYLIDEVLTPDSSRFWAADVYTPGRAQPSFDKQPLRDWLAAERAAGRWNGDAPPPALPREVVEAMSDRYLDAFRRITGTTFNTNLLT